MSKSVGIGIIGTGFARRVQIPAFIAAGAQIISVASGHLENARSTADEAGAGHFTSDWRETVAHDAVDLVCITTPPVYHREMTLAAIEHGKHILCEKPMAMNVAEAGEMASAAAGTSRLAMIDHELRFQPGRRVAYDMLRKGRIGKVRHARFLFQAPHRGDPALPWNWWSDIDAGGGALGAIGSHVIDSFLWLLGTDVSAVSGQLQTHIKTRDFEGSPRPVTTDDQANMLLRFADSELTADATGLVSLSMTEGPRFRSRLEIFGTGGTMSVDHRGKVYVAAPGDADFSEIDVELGKGIDGVADTGFARGFMSFAPAIVEALFEGRDHIEHAATFADGVRIQRVLDAVRASDESGRTILL